MSRRIVPFWFPNRGCPGRCTYCNQSHSKAEALLVVTPEEMEERLQEAARGAEGQFPVEVALFGGTFTGWPIPQQEMYLEAIQRLLAKGVIEAARVSTHPSLVGEEALRRLADHGVTTIELGIESLDDGVLSLANRGHDGQGAVEALRRCREFGFEVVGQLMPFLPGSSERSDVESVLGVCQCAPDALRLFPTVVLDGTELEAMWRRGEYLEASVDEGAIRCGKLAVMAEEAGVPVVRMGLQDGCDVRPHVLAGPYHPAFGELARIEMVASLLARASKASASIVDLSVDERLASLAAGHGKRLLSRLSTLRPEVDWRIETVGFAGNEGWRVIWRGSHFALAARGRAGGRSFRLMAAHRVAK